MFSLSLKIKINKNECENENIFIYREYIYRVEWGKTPLLRVVQLKQKLNVFRKVHSSRDNGINYKPSMKNVQSFQCY